MPVEDLNKGLSAIVRKLDELLELARRTNRRFVSIPDAAAHTGLSTTSIRRLIASGKLSPLRPVRGKIVLDLRQLESVVSNAREVPKTSRGRSAHP